MKPRKTRTQQNQKPVRNASAGALFLACGLLAGLPLQVASAAENDPHGPYYGVFRELRITDITPEGWLAELLQRQRDGLAMHRQASGFPFDTDLWVGKIPNAKWPAYEQTAYFVDGSYRCGLLLKDKPLTDLGWKNIRYVLDHPAANGRLGPGPGDYITVVAPDGVAGPQHVGIQWPMAVFTRALIVGYSATQVRSILEALTKHYESLPPDFGPGPRDVDSVEGMCWLYGQTGDKKILDIAERTWKNATRSPQSQWNLDSLTKETAMHGHGVTVTEATKQPALLYLYTGKREYLDAALGGFRSLRRDHELVDGVVTSDASLSGKAPDHQRETCVISDYTWSLGYVLMASGGAGWGDTIESAVLNAGLSVIGKDFKSHQYYSAPNQVVATQTGNQPTTGKPYRNLQAYRPDFSPECCTGNLQRMIPNYAARLWLSDGHGGLAAALYAPATVRTTAGDNRIPVTLKEKTDYPFDGEIRIEVTVGRPVKFPLYLRIPGWAGGASVTINGKPAEETPRPETFFKIERTFASGDIVQLNLPMKVRREEPVPNAVSLLRGPLVYALKIKEDCTKVTKTRAGDPDFPAWDLNPAGPWNYALAIASAEDLKLVRVRKRPPGGYPWSAENCPIVLTAPARRVEGWTITPEGTSPPLPVPPLAFGAETEEVELIPEGATRLRVSVFPIIPKSDPAKSRQTSVASMSIPPA